MGEQLKKKLIRRSVLLAVLAFAVALPSLAHTHTPTIDLVAPIDRYEVDAREPAGPELVVIDHATRSNFESVSTIELPPATIPDLLEKRLTAVTHVDDRQSLAVFAVKEKLASGLFVSLAENNINEASDLAEEWRRATEYQALPFAEPATGLIFARARWYDPSTGTFLTPDPLGYQDSSNLYTFAGGDPVNGRDPTGLEDDEMSVKSAVAHCGNQGAFRRGWKALVDWFSGPPPSGRAFVMQEIPGESREQYFARLRMAGVEFQEAAAATEIYFGAPQVGDEQLAEVARGPLMAAGPVTAMGTPFVMFAGANPLGAAIMTADSYSETGLSGQTICTALPLLGAATKEAVGLYRASQSIDTALGLRLAALRVHSLSRNARALRSSAVTVVRVTLANGEITYFAAGSGGRLSVVQKEMLISLGVPEGNILSGSRVTKGFLKIENHAERIIIRNVPEGATVDAWGISWAGKQKPIPCKSCTPHVEAVGGALQGVDP